MTARILVVDDLPQNLRLLQAMLLSEYFSVLTASNGLDAIELARNENPDVILLDVMMPDMDGYEVCRRLKEDDKVAHIPVVMVTALSAIEDRVKGLVAGADDFLNKPVDSLALIARVKSLARNKLLLDELRLREQTSQAATGVPFNGKLSAQDLTDSRILLICDDPVMTETVRHCLGDRYAVTAIEDGVEAVSAGASGDVKLVILNLDLIEVDALRLCSELRASEATRTLPILTIAQEDMRDQLLKALEIGVNDYVIDPLDRSELRARTFTQLCHKYYLDSLRHNVRESVTMAMTDSLTGLHNRRYLDRHLTGLVRKAVLRGTPLCICVLDIDHFKCVNDTYGHSVGDEVLRDFADRISRNLRGMDLAARFGGEEFVVVLPDTGVERARMVADRILDEVGGELVPIGSEPGHVRVTTSIGVAGLVTGKETPRELIDAADAALYAAKGQGRNQVVLADTIAASDSTATISAAVQAAS